MKSLALILTVCFCASAVFAETDLSTYQKKVSDAIRSSNESLCQFDLGARKLETFPLHEHFVDYTNSVKVVQTNNETTLLFTEPVDSVSVKYIKVVSDKKIKVIKSIETYYVDTLTINIGSAERPQMQTLSYMSVHASCEQLGPAQTLN